MVQSDGVTPYTGDFIKLEAGTNDVLFKTESPEVSTLFYIESFVNSTLQPECSFITPIQVPILLEICGTEQVLVEDQTPWNFTYLG